MHKNQFWLTFLCTIASIVCWFTITTGYELFQYSSLSQKTVPKKIIWTIVKKYSDRYILKAEYLYEVKGHEYKGSTEFDQVTYRNHSAIKQSISQKKKTNWPVWYHLSSPKDSTIEKKYPLKSLVYTVILWAILFYFSWLGMYVRKFET